MRSHNNRQTWKYILASTVMALSVTTTCGAQQRGQIIDAVLERYDDDNCRRVASKDFQRQPAGNSDPEKSKLARCN